MSINKKTSILDSIGDNFSLGDYPDINSLSPNEMKDPKKFNATSVKMSSSSAGDSPMLGGGSGEGDVKFADQFYGYSPIFSVDFFERPRDLPTIRLYYMYFYENDPIVGRAIDLHTDVPLSHIKIKPPKIENSKISDYVHSYFKKMFNRLDLFKATSDILFEENLMGFAFIWAEDDYDRLEDRKYLAHSDLLNSSMRYFIDSKLEHQYNHLMEVDDEEKDGKFSEYKELLAKAEDDTTELFYKRKDYLEEKQYQIFRSKETNKSYKGVKRIEVLPPEQLNVTFYDFTDYLEVELIPDSSSRENYLATGTTDYGVESDLTTVPQEAKEALSAGDNLTLSTNPLEGSFVHHMYRRKSHLSPYGVSILARAYNMIVYRDKLRQIQTLLISRNMTPKRLINIPEAPKEVLDDFRDQVELATLDPDYAIITNYEVDWKEIGVSDRLFSLNDEYAHSSNLLYVALVVFEELLTGASTWSGSRVTLEVLNALYFQVKERYRKYIEDYIIKPVAIKKNFIMLDQHEQRFIVAPSVSFSRTTLRDSQEVFEELNALYQKGAFPLEDLLEIMGFDSDNMIQKLEDSLMTVKDNNFNTVMQSMYNDSSRELIEGTDFVNRISSYLRLSDADTSLSELAKSLSSSFLNDPSAEEASEASYFENLSLNLGSEGDVEEGAVEASEETPTSKGAPEDKSGEGSKEEKGSPKDSSKDSSKDPNKKPVKRDGEFVEKDEYKGVPTKKPPRSDLKKLDDPEERE